MDATLGWGYEPLHDHSGPFDGEVALGGRFGFANGRPAIAGMGGVPAAGSGWISNPTPFSFVLSYSMPRRSARHRRPGAGLH